MHTKPVTLFMIDDDQVDIRAFKRALLKKKVLNPVRTAANGTEALAILRGEEGHIPLHRPFIILLDINMPQMNGLEFLHEMRADPALHDNVVFVLTTSDADQDKMAAYDKHVAGYIVKSRLQDDFLDLINMLKPYWRIIELPEHSPQDDRA